MTPAPQPASKPHRRWFQFSLRTMLIGTAVIAAILAVGLRWIVPAQRQRAAVKIVERLGGKVQYAESPSNESWVVDKMRSWLPRDYTDAVIGLDLNNTKTRDNDLARLVGLTELRRIDLAWTYLTDAGLAHLDGFAHLQELRVEETDVTDIGLKHLIRFRELRMLLVDYGGRKLTDTGVAELQEALPLCDIQLWMRGIGPVKWLPSSQDQ